MKKETFKQVKTISLLFSFMHLFGYLFFSDHYLSGTFIYIFFVTSTGLALFTIPLIPDRLLELIIVRIVVIFLGAVGIINNLYSMSIDLTLPYSPDIPAFLIRIIVLAILVILVIRSINPKFIK